MSAKKFMQFDQDNHVVSLCAKGMELEAEQNFERAKEVFEQAWNDAKGNFEKFIAAHYVARHQKSIEDKLSWDQKALSFALKIKNKGMLANYPSLFLNIAKCYEDLGDADKAQENYQKALLHVNNLSDEGYGQMIRTGIQNGIRRITRKQS